MLKLFCDGSVNPQLKVGFGAYFILDENRKTTKEINSSIQIKKFENTSSTKLELEVLLWALEDNQINQNKLTIYTDCQNILNLENRRAKLEQNDYRSSTGKIIKNHELYKKFYTLFDKLKFDIQKVKGHKKSSLKNETDELFNLVDKASRKALRQYI